MASGGELADMINGESGRCAPSAPRFTPAAPRVLVASGEIHRSIVNH